MIYNIEIRPLATLEIIEGYEWYQSQKEGLGLEFLDSIERFNKALLQNPFIHSYLKGTTRQGCLHKFPYTVVYEIIENTVVIYSVFMNKQNPQKKPLK